VTGECGADELRPASDAPPGECRYSTAMARERGCAAPAGKAARESARHMLMRHAALLLMRKRQSARGSAAPSAFEF